MRIGLFGGSFDPVHVGHVAAARAVLEQLPLGLLLLVPAWRQPFKETEPAASASDRVRMLRLAFADLPDCRVDETEIERGGTSYTADTLRSLDARFPRDQLSLIIGADNTREFAGWRDHDVIRELAEVVVVTRPGEPVVDAAEYVVVQIPPHDVSASEIRSRLQSGLQVDGMVPPSVLSYIRDRGLYESGV